MHKAALSNSSSVCFLQVAYNVADNVPKLVFCDAQRLQQILLNVLNNAVKFTEKGEILVEVWCEPQESPKAQQQEAASSKQQSAADQQQSSAQHAQHDSAADNQQDSCMAKSFRPLTPDNLSQHNQFARLRTAKHGQPNEGETEGQKERAGLLYGKSTDCRQQQQLLSQEPQQHQSSAEQPTTVRHLLAETAQRAQHLVLNTAQHAKQAMLGSNNSQQSTPSDTPSSQDHSSQQQSQPSQVPQTSLQASPSGDSQATLVYQPQQADSFADAKPALSAKGERHIETTAHTSASQQAEEVSRLFRREQSGTSSSDRNSSSGSSSLQSRRHAIGGREDLDRNLRFNSIMPSTSGRSSRSEARPDLNTDYVIHFSIRDSGIGISESQMKSLFQRFCQVSSLHEACCWQDQTVQLVYICIFGCTAMLKCCLRVARKFCRCAWHHVRQGGGLLSLCMNHHNPIPTLLC